ncbi:MAG: uracil-DNA glycosylase [Clostridiales bacterium]|jgi:uracil-DNA glycosylase|nr:uracil-DNA glycosylase [Clostridiales bacterium]
MIKLGNDWDEFLDEETRKPYYLELRKFLKSEYSSRRIYPPMNDIFNAMRHTPLANVRAVVLGQDPYINPGEAHGLAFSVQPGAKAPPSLRNILKELHDDAGIPEPPNGCLLKWADNGVMLLNRVLTVAAGASRSHAGRGWETFTRAAIERVNAKEAPVVFLLWGKDAQGVAEYITNPRHLVLTAAHPSPLAGGRFFGCRHFSKANEFLTRNGAEPIDWSLE